MSSRISTCQLQEDASSSFFPVGNPALHSVYLLVDIAVIDMTKFMNQAFSTHYLLQ